MENEKESSILKDHKKKLRHLENHLVGWKQRKNVFAVYFNKSLARDFVKVITFGRSQNE